MDYAAIVIMDLLDSSSSSEESESSYLSSSDSDLELFLEIAKAKPPPPPRKRNYFDDVVPSLTDEQFIEHFRVSRAVYEQLTEKFKRSPYYKYQTGGNGKIAAEKVVATFLWFCGRRSSSYREVAKRFGLSPSTSHAILTRVTLFASNMAEKVVTWPGEEEKVEIARRFAPFANVIGVLGVTHVKVDKPSQDPDSYLNRDQSYSIQCQLVCDHQCRIRDIFVGYPGSVHKSKVFPVSSLYNSLGDKCGDFVLLGDSGYPCLPQLMTPYKDNGKLSRKQKSFNKKLAEKRHTVEHCNGLLKQKFRQLDHLKLRKMRLMIHFIRACAVLHNLSLDDNFPFDESQIADNSDLNNEETRLLEDGDGWADDPEGIAVRNELCNSLH